MTVMRALGLVLLLSTAAFADTINGEVDIIRELEDPAAPEGSTVDVALIKAADGKLYRITDKLSVDTLFWLERDDVVLEGTIADSTTAPAGTPGENAKDFEPTRIVEPEFEPNMHGVVWSTKSGLSGRRSIELADGTVARVSGPNFLAIYSLTKDLQKRAINFSAFKLKNRDGKVRELVVMEIEAKAKEDFILMEGAATAFLKLMLIAAAPPLIVAEELHPEIRGEVSDGDTVWIVRRSLMGGLLQVRDKDHATGFTSWERLEIGKVVGDDYEFPEPNSTLMGYLGRLLGGTEDEPQQRTGAVGGMNTD